MSTSQNNWPVLAADSPKLHTWVIPARTGEVRIRLRNGSAGFLLAHLILWWAEVLEPVRGKVLDDWGYAYRPIRGSSTGYSNHASGTAADVNATRWPLGTEHMTARMKTRIRVRLRLYRACIRWGGDYSGRKDQMHIEINRGMPKCERVAKLLAKTPRGRRILRANLGQREVIWS